MTMTPTKYKASPRKLTIEVGRCAICPMRIADSSIGFGKCELMNSKSIPIYPKEFPDFPTWCPLEFSDKTTEGNKNE